MRRARGRQSIVPRCVRTALALAFLRHALPTAALAGTIDAPPLAPRLPEMMQRAELVVLGDLGATSEHDDGRLLRAHLRVSRELRGAQVGDGVEVVEERRFASVAPALRMGRRVVAFLKTARPTTQLRRALPPDQQYYRMTDDRWGLVDLPDAAGERAVIAALEGWIALAAGGPEDPARPQAAERSLVFVEIGAGHERLVEDGVAALAGLPGLAGTLTPAEQDTITGALHRASLPERLRLGLVKAIADADLRSLVPALRDLPGAGPQLLRASALARVQLGQGPDRGEIESVLRTGDPASRAALVPALLRSEAGGIAAVSALALEDPAPEVRLAAIEALGESASPDALPVLRRTFVDTDPGIRRMSGQAIHRIGGRPAAEALADLAFTAPPDGQRQAVALLLTLGVTPDDPFLARIRETHPDPEVRKLVTTGIEVHQH